MEASYNMLRDRALEIGAKDMTEELGEPNTVTEAKAA
jgi:hypothetical protein